MPKDRKNLDFEELVRQPGFEWIRLYFEKNYRHKNFILEPVMLNTVEKKENVYYVAYDTYIHSSIQLNGKGLLSRLSWQLFDRIVYRNSRYSYVAIKITII